MRSSRSGHKEHSTPRRAAKPTHLLTHHYYFYHSHYRSLPLPLQGADCPVPYIALPCPEHTWPRLDWRPAGWLADGGVEGQARVRLVGRLVGWMDGCPLSPLLPPPPLPIGDSRWGFGSMQLDCRCQGQKCRYARGMQRRQSSGGNHARKALLAYWPRKAAPLIIAALASAQFQRSGTRTQSVASPVCKRRERVGHPIWQPWQLFLLLVVPAPYPFWPRNQMIRIVQGHAARDQCFLWLQHPSTRSRFEDCHG